jgi:hypothetical protein
MFILEDFIAFLEHLQYTNFAVKDIDAFPPSGLSVKMIS